MSELSERIDLLEKEHTELSDFKSKIKNRKIDYVTFPAKMLTEIFSQIDTGYRNDFLPLFRINHRENSVEFQADEGDYNDPKKEIMISPNLANFIVKQVMNKGIQQLELDYSEGEARFEEDFSINE